MFDEDLEKTSLSCIALSDSRTFASASMAKANSAINESSIVCACAVSACAVLCRDPFEDVVE